MAMVVQGEREAPIIPGQEKPTPCSKESLPAKKEKQGRISEHLRRYADRKSCNTLVGKRWEREDNRDKAKRSK